VQLRLCATVRYTDVQQLLSLAPASTQRRAQPQASLGVCCAIAAGLDRVIVAGLHPVIAAGLHPVIAASLHCVIAAGVVTRLHVMRGCSAGCTADLLTPFLVGTVQTARVSRWTQGRVAFATRV
jgi:hypothetical protein